MSEPRFELGNTVYFRIGAEVVGGDLDSAPEGPLTVVDIFPVDETHWYDLDCRDTGRWYDIPESELVPSNPRAALAAPEPDAGAFPCPVCGNLSAYWNEERGGCYECGICGAEMDEDGRPDWKSRLDAATARADAAEDALRREREDHRALVELVKIMLSYKHLLPATMGAEVWIARANDALAALDAGEGEG